MKVVIFGASGQTGRELVTQALELGHVVTAFARRPETLGGADGRVRVVQGDIVDVAAVTRAVEGQEAVLSALGASNPMRPYPEFRTGVANIVKAMQTSDVRRLVYLSFLGVRAGEERLGFFLNQVAARLLRHAIADHAANERTIRASRLVWTIVLAPTLTRGRRTRTYRSGEDVAIQSVVPSISRADVADFMLRQLAEVTYVGRSPRIMN
jgi:putative NADH-flavin reductase